eukprot:jgi/Picsp_1/2996/NSC_01219-R1_protein
MAGIVFACWRLYLQRLKKKPLVTKSITAGVICAMANTLSQWIVKANSTKKIDAKTVAKFAAFGMLWVGPSGHYWQSKLENLAPTGVSSKKKRQTKSSGPDSKRAVMKTIIDQLVYGPMANLIFLAFIAKAVEGKSFKSSINGVKSQFWKTQVRGWLVWPLAQYIN